MYKFARSASSAHRTVVRLNETTFAALVRDKSTNSFSVARFSTNQSEPLDSAVVFPQIEADAVLGLMSYHAYEPTRLVVYAASVDAGCTVAAFSLAQPWAAASFAHSKLPTSSMAVLTSAAMSQYLVAFAFSVATESEVHVLAYDGPQTHKLGRSREAKVQVVAGAFRCFLAVQRAESSVFVCNASAPSIALTAQIPDRIFLSYLSDQRPEGFVPCIREVMQRNLSTFHIPRT